MDEGFILVRVDGKGFSKFTKFFKQADEYNSDIQDAMILAAAGLVENVDGAIGAYTVSDEISLLIANRGQDTWYAGRHDKIVSLTAAYATAWFNKKVTRVYPPVFDSRIVEWYEEGFTLREYFLERRSSGISNAVSSYASRYLGHKFVLGISTRERIEMLDEVGIQVPKGLAYGYLIYKENYTTSVVYTHKKTGEEITVPNVQRSRWETKLFGDVDDIKLMVE